MKKRSQVHQHKQIKKLFIIFNNLLRKICLYKRSNNLVYFIIMKRKSVTKIEILKNSLNLNDPHLY